MKVEEQRQTKEKRRYWQAPLAILCLFLGFLVAANYLIPAAPVASPSPEAEAAEKDTAAVAAEAPTYESEFFSDYRTKRAAWRGEEQAYYEDQLAQTDLTEEHRLALSEALYAVIAKNQTEDQVEELLRGRNYGDALLVLGDNLSFLIVKKETLSAAESEELASFVYAYAAIPAGTLSVYNVP